MTKLHWKQSFKKDISRKLKASEEEYKKYLNTHKIIYLQQAGNKLFSIVENYLMLKYGERKKDYKSLFHMVKNNKNDRTLLRDAVQLHYFFYNGELDMPKFIAEDFYESVRNRMKNRLR